MFKNFLFLGWLMVHGIIQQYARMDIHSKISSRLEENTDIILSVLLTHTESITLQQDLMMREVMVAGLLQVIDKHRSLNLLVIH